MEEHSYKGQHKAEEEAAAEQKAYEETHSEGSGCEVKQGTDRDEVAMPGLRGHLHLQGIMDDPEPPQEGSPERT